MEGGADHYAKTVGTLAREGRVQRSSQAVCPRPALAYGDGAVEVEANVERDDAEDEIATTVACDRRRDDLRQVGLIVDT